MRWIPLAVMLLCMGWGCEQKVRPTIVPILQSQPPSQESWQSTVTFSDSARVKAVLWAGYIAVYGDQRQTLLSDSLHVDFYNEQQIHTSALTARRGIVNDQTRDFEAYEHVIVTSDSGTTLKTDRLFWDNASRKIHTDAFVDILSAKEHIMGQGMVSDQSLKNYKIFKVTGQAVTNE